MKIEKLEQRVELIAQEVDALEIASHHIDAYTKAQADSKFETQSHASSTYATKTELSNVKQVPTVTSEDNGKILKAVYSEGSGGYQWEAAPTLTQVQADWNVTDDTSAAFIKNKPTIPAAQVQSNWAQTNGDAADYIKNKPNLSDMATQTWVGQQGFLTSADEVPTVGSTDDGKVLKATYSGGVGSYSWETPSSTTQVQADWTETNTSAASYIQHKPDLTDMATKTWVGQQNYLTSSDLSGYATQTWVGQQGYLTSADEVPDVTSSDDGKVLTATYSGGQGSYAWATPASGGGLSVETDGTNYWITVNSIRLYFASSAPTGTIPDGSYGIGW